MREDTRMMTENLLKKSLRFDALDAAETLTGERVDAGGAALGLGLMLLQKNSALKKALLTDRDDTIDGDLVERFTRIIEANGFEKVFELPFTCSTGDRDEAFFIYAHRDGLLLKFDTYDGARINSGNVYYNWEPDPETKDRFEFTSSGSFVIHEPDRKVWAGDHDAREALIFKIDQLRANGKFVTPWVEAPFLWLLHHEDSKQPDYDHHAINAARLAAAPQWVRDFVGPYEK